MKNKPLILFVISILLIFGIFLFQRSSSELSPQQTELIDMWGYPDQFKVVYLPKGENELIRSEVWMYASQNKQVQFLAGKSINSSSYSPESQDQTTLKPEDFSFFQNQQDVEEFIGEGVLEPIDFLPGISDEENQIAFISPQAVFIIENDHLTFIQTHSLEISQEDSIQSDLDNIQDKQDLLEETSVDYHSDFLGFSTSYPQNWFLSDDILTTYDSNKPLNEIVLPEKFLKCDFLLYNPNSLSISSPVIINDQITRGTASDLIFSDGPGLGDAIIYKIDNPTDSLALLCYSYDPQFESELINMLKSITFDSR